MKTNYYFFRTLLFCSVLSQAQLSLTKSAFEPVIGDVRMMAAYDSVSTLPKNTGTGQVWNFSSLSPKSFSETTTYLNVASTPAASLFPTATISGRRGSDNYEYFRSNGSNWEFLGQFKSSNNEKLVLSDPGVFTSWPVSFGSTNNDVGEGIETSGSNTSTLNAALSYTATGAGTVILPGGVSHNNCLQVFSVLTLTIISGSSTSTVTEITYDYYSDSKKFPIVQLQFRSETSGSGTTKEYGLYLNADGLVVGLSEAPVFGNNISVFPNPANEKVFFKSPAKTKFIRAEVKDITGRTLLHSSEPAYIDVSDLPPAFYIASMHFESGVITKSFVVSR